MSSDTLSLLLAAGILTAGGISLFMFKNHESEEQPDSHSPSEEVEKEKEEDMTTTHAEDIYDLDTLDNNVHFSDMLYVQPVKRKPSSKRSQHNRRQHSLSKRRY